MTILSITAKKQHILDHERKMAHEVALGVLEKPKPPLWMIFVPVFFVFFAQKMGQYKSGLASFAENYLKMRHRALEACLEFSKEEDDARGEKLINAVGPIPEEAREPFERWMRLLAEHYDRLLQARGEDLAAMIRHGYGSRTNYLLFCNNLNKAENAYNLALLPKMQGERDDLLYVIEKMHTCVTNLRRKEADRVFP